MQSQYPNAPQTPPPKGGPKTPPPLSTLRFLEIPPPLFCVVCPPSPPPMTRSRKEPWACGTEKGGFWLGTGFPIGGGVQKGGFWGFWGVLGGSQKGGFLALFRGFWGSFSNPQGIKYFRFPQYPRRARPLRVKISHIIFSFG